MPAIVEVVIDVKEATSLMKRLAPALDRNVAIALQISARQIADTAKNILDQGGHVKTSALRNSIKPGAVEGRFSTGDIQILIPAGGATVGYALFVEDGTKPHVIEAVSAGSRPFAGPNAKTGKGATLRMNIGGRTIFRKRVHHPGTKPVRYMQQAIDSNADFIADQFEQAVELSIAEAEQ